MSDPQGDAVRAGQPPAPANGVRAGLLVLIASMVGHAGNFLFYVVAARQLEPSEFAEVAAITALGLIAFTPVNGIAAAAARDVAQAEAAGYHEQSRASISWLIRRVLIVQAVVFAFAVALTPVASSELGISNPLSWLLAAAWLSLGIALPALLGPLQGLGKFSAVGLMLSGPLGLFRVVLLIPLGAVLGVPGAVSALLLATVVGIVLGWRSLGPLRRKLSVFRRVDRDRGQIKGLLIAVLALLAFASLTNIDVVLAKATLDGTQAATYASAALLGKIALYGPVALSLVLLPNVSARIVQGVSTIRPILLTRAATLGCGLMTALIFWLTPSSFIVALFGESYGDAHPLLVPLALVMTAAALLNVDVTLAIARNDRRLIIALVVLAVAHVALLIMLGDSPFGLILASAITIGAGLLGHELVSQDGVVRQMFRLAGERRQNAAAG